MAFTDRTLTFLAENKIHDDKLWFTEHREEYDTQVLTPLRQLVVDLSPAMTEIDPELICEPKIGGSISRIYRDTRFSNDKSIFRDVMWVVFLRTKKENIPGFWCEISPRGMNWGCGWYYTEPAVMAAARELILSGDSVAKKAMAAQKKQRVFAIEDNRYKRPKYPDAPEEQRQWLEQRCLCFIACSRDADFICSPTLSERLAEDFKLLKPQYEFMLKAYSRAVKK